MNENVTLDRDWWIGGSDIPAIMGVSTFSSAYDLAREKVGLIEQDNTFTQKYIDYGNVMEPKIRDYINETRGCNYKEWSTIKENTRLRANVDGYDPEATIQLLEIKTHGNMLRQEEYNLQMQLYMYIFDVRHCLLATYEREDNTDMFAMTDFNTEFNPNRLEITICRRDDELLEDILKKCDLFIPLLDTCKEQRLSKSEFDAELYNVNPIMQYMNELDEVMMASERLKTLAKREKELKEEIRLAMLDNGIYTIETDMYKLTASKDSVSKKLDSKSLQVEYPEIYDTFVVESKRKGSLRVTKINK